MKIAEIKKLPQYYYGMYFIIYKGLILYLGVSTDVKNRVTSHFKNKKFRDSFDNCEIFIIPYERASDMIFDERHILRNYPTFLNKMYNGVVV